MACRNGANQHEDRWLDRPLSLNLRSGIHALGRRRLQTLWGFDERETMPSDTHGYTEFGRGQELVRARAEQGSGDHGGCKCQS